MSGAGLGFLAITVSVLGFGSNFVPVKKYDAGDGLFFQWVMCSAIWWVGLIVQLIRGAPKFEPLAMVGGVLWCTGNVLCVPIIHLIGIGMGILIWGGSNLIFGWLSGYLGLFGLKKDEVNHPGLNIAGFVISFCSLFVFLFVKSEGSNSKKNNEKYPPLLGNRQTQDDIIDRHMSEDYTTYAISIQEDNPFRSLDTLSAASKQLIGWVGSVVAGVFFGLNFDPPQYLMDNPNHDAVLSRPPHSTNALDYVFSHFSGIFATSTFWFLIYCAVKRNKPLINPSIVLPGAVSGVLWAIAQTALFVANEKLSLVVSFPISCTLPGIVASLWGIFMFKEIKGTRNIFFFCLAVCITVIGVIFITFSKISV